MERQSQTHSRHDNGASGNNRAHSKEDPDEIQEDIHRTRERIDETLDAIKHQLSPGDLLSQVMGMFRKEGGGGVNVSSKAGELLSSLARTVKDNPIPIALIGIGLLGLAKDGGSKDGGSKTRSSSEHKPGERGVGEVAEKVQEKTGEVAEKVQEKTGEAGEKLGEAGEKLEGMAAEARDKVERTYDKVRERIEDDPIVLGALGIALGAALGAGLPRTRIEDETFGQKRDELAAKAKQVGEQIREGVKQVADEQFGDEDEQVADEQVADEPMQSLES